MTTTNLTARQLAILASAYNVHGPRSGEAARPATVLTMTTMRDLVAMADLYAASVVADPDAIYSADDVRAARAALAVKA